MDEYLRFCTQEGITPIITTAFCKDHPGNVDPNDHPNGIRHPYVVSYLKTGDDMEFIDRLEPRWTGALPATFIYDGGGSLRDFWEGKASYARNRP